MTHEMRVSVAGVLSDSQGRPIKQAPVSASIEDHTVATANTRGNGQFHLTFDVPGEYRSGNRQLVVHFGGDGSHSATQASVTLALGPGAPSGGAAPTPASAPPAEPAPPVEPPANGAPASPSPSGGRSTTPSGPSQLTVEADDTSPRNGAVVALSGQLLAPDGQPLSGAYIDVLDPSGEVPDSFTVTGADGGYATFYAVPTDQRDALQLTVRFGGSEAYPAAQASVDLAVRVLETASPSPSPEPSPEPSPTPPKEQELNPSVVTDLTSALPTPAGTEEPSLLTGWVIGAVFVVGASAVIIASVVVVSALRRSHVPGAPAPESEFNFFEDDDADALATSAPRRGGGY